jgi:4-amino-4-deoxy-L-arabinose transferase-like glycosyltransferase
VPDRFRNVLDFNVLDFNVLDFIRSSQFMRQPVILLSCLFWSCFFCGLTFLVQSHSFFWDTVMLASMQGQWFFAQGFVPFPPDIDVGHPPLLPCVLALSWQCFGKSLAVSHWTMMPFLLVIVLAAHRLALHFFSSRQAVFCAALLLVQPTLLAQATLVSPDIPLVAFFLCSLCCFFEQKHEQKCEQPQKWSGFNALYLMLLAMTSLRGMIAVAMLLFAETILHWRRKRATATWLALLRLYLPALAIFAAWYVWHRLTSGVIGWHNPASTEFYRTLTDIPGLAKNLVVFVWRLFDLGAGVVWCVLGASMYASYRRGILKYHWNYALVALGGVMLAGWLLIVAILPIYSIGHRYFLPLQILAVLAAFQGMKLFSTRVRGFVACLCCTALLTGHWWVFLYPTHVAKGWDATLAYLPYNNLRNHVLMRVQERDILEKDVASRNFATYSRAFLDLETSSNAHNTAFKNAPLDSVRYVFLNGLFPAGLLLNCASIRDM